MSSELHWRIGYEKAFCFQKSGQFDQAESLARRLLELPIPDDVAHGDIINMLGLTRLDKGLFSEAEQFYKRALKIREVSGFKDKLAISYNNLGYVASNRGQLQKALDLYKQSAKLFEETGKKKLFSTPLTNLGRLYADLGEVRLSKEYYLAALELRKELGDQSLIQRTIVDLLQVFREFNLKTEAILLVERNLSFKRRLPVIGTLDLVKKAIMSMFEGTKSENQGSPLHLWETALNRKALPFEHKLLAYESLAEILLKSWRKDNSQGVLVRLQQHLAEWQTVCEKNKLSPAFLKAKIISGKLSSNTFNFEKAEDIFGETIKISEKTGLTLHMELARRELEKIEDFKTFFKGASKPEFEEVEYEEILTYIKNIRPILAQFRGAQE